MPNGTLTVLGCDGSFAGPGGAGSGYLMRSAAATIWLDAGPGTFARLQEVIFPGVIDAIVLSHDYNQPDTIAAELDHAAQQRVIALR